MHSFVNLIIQIKLYFVIAPSEVKSAIASAFKFSKVKSKLKFFIIFRRII
jgi:hypothetical protein